MNIVQHLTPTKISFANRQLDHVDAEVLVQLVTIALSSPTTEATFASESLLAAIGRQADGREWLFNKMEDIFEVVLVVEGEHWGARGRIISRFKFEETGAVTFELYSNFRALLEKQPELVDWLRHLASGNRNH